MNYDAKVVVKAEIDTKGFDKQLKDIEHSTERSSETVANQIQDEINDMYDEIAQNYGEETADLLKKLSEITDEFNEINSDKQIISSEDIKKIEELKKNAQEINKELKKTTGIEFYIKGLTDAKQPESGINDELKKIGKSITGIVKKVGMWALALFGVRGAFSFIRSSMSTLSQYDKEMASNVEYIRWALAVAIKPIVEWIIKAVFTLLNVLNALLYKLFGINIFAHATAKDFQNAKRSASDLKKTLAGFDEMNILNKDGTTGVATSLDFNVNDGLNSFKKFKENLKKINWEEVAEYIGNKITSTLTDPDFWRGVWEKLVWVVENVFVFPAHFLNDIITDLFSNSKKTMDSNGNLITEEKSFVEKLVGRIVGTFLQTFNIMFNPVGFFIDKFKKDKQKITDELETNAENFGGNYALAFIDSFLSQFTLYRIFKETITKIVALWNSTLGKLTGKKITIDVIYNQSPVITPGVGGRAKGGIFYPSKLPKLAVGGIINQPGRGVPYNGAYIGERGAEAVVPLTDSQQMALLGETIGKYVTINATIPVYAYNRQVDRQIRVIRAEDNFAGNR